MIKSYKNWLNTVHEAVTIALNENKSEDLVKILAKNSDFLPKYVVGGEGKKFVRDWEKMSNKVVMKGSLGRYSGDSYANASEVARALEKCGVIFSSAEQKIGDKQEIFRYPRFEESSLSKSGIPDLGRKRVVYNNAASNLVRVKTKTAINFGADEKGGLSDVYGLVHGINMYNLRYAFGRIGWSLNFDAKGSLFKGAKKKSKQWGMGEKNGSNSPSKRMVAISDVSGDSIVISKITKLDPVHGPDASWFRDNYDYENKELTYEPTKTILIPLYTVKGISVATGTKVPASEMVTRKISTVVKGSTTTLENSIAGVNKLFDQGKATISNAKLKAGLGVAVEKQLAQFDAITSIVVTGGASFEWQGGQRDDAKNKDLAEKRAQYVADMIKENHKNLKVTTGGAAAAKIQPNENQDEVENWRKVYLKITGTVTGDDQVKEVTFDELESANWAKDRVLIDCYWIAIDAHNQNNPNAPV